MSAPHTRIAQPLDQWNVRFEIFNLLLHFVSNFLTGRDVLEMLDALEDCLERIAHVLLQLFSIDCCQRIIHPTVVPFLPVRGGQPHVFKRIKILDELTKFVILWRQGTTVFDSTVMLAAISYVLLIDLIQI